MKRNNESNNKQSSVIHIRNWVRTNGDMSEDGKSITYSCEELEAIIAEAKAMHNKEHGNTWDASMNNFKVRGMNIVRAWEDFDEYYNETYGGNE